MLRLISMGIDETIEYGPNCLLCWPPGLKPKYLWAVWNGTVLCPWAAGVGLSSPPRLLKMEQTVACSWVFDDGQNRAAYGAQLPRASLMISSGGVLFFNGLGVGPCDTRFANHLGCIPGFQSGSGGLAGIWY